MTPLAPETIRARTRPAAVLFVFFAELAWALLVATPVHAWAGRVWGAHPDGDAVLFTPGGRDLMVWLGQSDAALGVTARTTIVLIAVGAVLMQLPLGALLASLAFGRDEDERPLRIVSALRAGMSAFLPLAVLLVLGTVASVVLLALGALASSAVDHGLTERLGDARAFRAHIVTFGLFAAIACVVGVFVDLARAAVGRDVGLAAANGTPSSAWNILLCGVKTALTTSRQALPRATLAWAWRAVATTPASFLRSITTWNWNSWVCLDWRILCAPRFLPRWRNAGPRVSA